jgi:hypothetical protein
MEKSNQQEGNHIGNALAKLVKNSICQQNSES